MNKVLNKILIEVDPNLSIIIENECARRGQSFSDFFLECYREKILRERTEEAEKIQSQMVEDVGKTKRKYKKKALDDCQK